MELIQQARGRLTEAALTGIFPFQKSEMEPKSSGREDDGEESLCSQSLSYSEYGLNPHAEEFVPSHLKGSLQNELNVLVKPERETKSEATSTTSLFPPESLRNHDTEDQQVNVAADDKDDSLNVKRQIFEFLSQMGDEKLSLDSIKVTLQPEGQGINIQFTTGQELSVPGTSVSTGDIKTKKLFKKDLCSQTVLNLDMTDQEKLANKPENVLVAQFLLRASEMLSEKFEWNAPTSTTGRPKCLICANRSYTEMEIEQQIDGIKSFEKFLSLTDSIRFPDLTSNKEFKQLCCQLGLIMNNDQTNSEHSIVSTEIGRVEDNGCHTSDGQDPQTTTEYVCGKIYRHDDSNGESTLVNQLEGDGELYRPMENKLYIYNDGEQLSLDAPPTTPAVSKTMTNLSQTKVHKLAKTKWSSRPQTYNSNPSRKNGKLQNEKINLNLQKVRLSTGEGNGNGAGNKTTKKAHHSTVFPSGKKVNSAQHATLPRSTGHQQSTANSYTGRQGQTKSMAGLNNSKHQVPSSSVNYGSKVIKGNSTKNSPVGHNLNQKIVPRSTTASLMRQIAVKRRLSLLRGESDSDVPFSEYLFK